MKVPRDYVAEGLEVGHNGGEFSAVEQLDEEGDHSSAHHLMNRAHRPAHPEPLWDMVIVLKNLLNCYDILYDLEHFRKHCLKVFVFTHPVHVSNGIGPRPLDTWRTSPSPSSSNCILSYRSSRVFSTFSSSWLLCHPQPGQLLQLDVPDVADALLLRLPVLPEIRDFFYFYLIKKNEN